MIEGNLLNTVTSKSRYVQQLREPYLQAHCHELCELALFDQSIIHIYLGFVANESFFTFFYITYEEQDFEIAQEFFFFPNMLLNLTPKPEKRTMQLDWAKAVRD